ncbi:MAG: GAF domain-containing protein [Nitrospirota bacterium]
MESDIHGKSADEFFQMFRRGAEFTKNLIKENESLKSRVAKLEAGKGQSGDEKKIRLYEGKIRIIHDEFKALLNRYKKTQEENKDLLSKCSLVQKENNSLANLYIASYQLHSTLDFNEVLNSVVEIIINLIGAETFVIFLMDDKTNVLLPAASEGLRLGDVPRIVVGDGTIGKVAKTGESYFSDGGVQRIDSEPDTLNPVVCIPLKIKEHVIGVIALYALFVQKTALSQIDYELFNLLAGHAATALFSSRLYTQSERKLTTIQNFLDLLKDKKRKTRIPR